MSVTVAKAEPDISQLALEATLIAMGGTGWTVETLKAIYDAIVAIQPSLTAADVWTFAARTLTNLGDLRASYLDNINNAQLLNVPNLTALTAARIGYLDNINQAGLLQVTAARAAYLDLLNTYLDASVAAVQAKTDLIPAIPMPSIIPSQGFPFTNPAVAVSLLNVMMLGDYGPYALSDDVLFDNPTERSISSQVYVKLKEINVGYYGATIRTYFEFKAGSIASVAYATVYKNGVSFGAERSNDTVAYVGYPQDLAFAKSDLFQIYVKTTNAGYLIYARNHQIRGTFSVPTIPAATGGY